MCSSKVEWKQNQSIESSIESNRMNRIFESPEIGSIRMMARPMMARPSKSTGRYHMHDEARPVGVGGDELPDTIPPSYHPPLYCGLFSYSTS